MPRVLSRGDVVVERAHARVVAEAANSAAPLRDLETAIWDALEGAADDLGDEVLVIRSVSLVFRAVTDGSSIGADLRHAIRSAVRREIARSRRTAMAEASDGDAMLFPSEAAAVSSYLVALRRGSASAWSHRAFRSWGADWSAVIRESLGRGKAFAGDVIAGVYSAVGGDEFAVALPVDAARAMIAAWQQKDGSTRLEWSRLPSDVRAGLAPAESVGSEIALATKLAHVLAAWPPARSMAVEVEGVEAPIRSPDARACLPSRACGLAYWLVLLADLAVDRALIDAYADTRVRRAARWALGRALQAGDVDGCDPALLLFAGEAPGRAVAPVASLGGASAEALHALAIRLDDKPGGHLRLVRVGNATVALDGAVVVDTVDDTEPDNAIGLVVRSFRRRRGREPVSISVQGATPEDIEIIHRVDVPALPTPWRGAIRALASVLRAAAATDGDATATHGWVGTVFDGTTIEIARRDVERVASAAWTSAFPLAVEERFIALRVAG